MIVCPNCNHPNQENAIQCAVCLTPLPSAIACPNCGAVVQVDANFCGQCGFRLQHQTSIVPEALVRAPLIPTHPSSHRGDGAKVSPLGGSPSPLPIAAPPQDNPPPGPPPPTAQLPPSSPTTPQTVASSRFQTKLQRRSPRLLHVQTNTSLELPSDLTLIHLGKPNEQVPPDIDLSGFSHAEIISRVHADIRVEGDTYYIEDVGSANGTYINGLPLPQGNRHRLRPGDRIAFGKSNLVTFLFQEP